MLTISFKSKKIFLAINENFIGPEEKLQIAYYKAQGCLLEIVESYKFPDECKCNHCKTLEHKFEETIEEIKKDV